MSGQQGVSMLSKEKASASVQTSAQQRCCKVKVVWVSWCVLIMITDQAGLLAGVLVKLQMLK